MTNENLPGRRAPIDSSTFRAHKNSLEHSALFNRGSLAQISAAIDRIADGVGAQNPNLSGITLYKNIAIAMPRLGHTVQFEAARALANPDPLKANDARKILLFTNLHTILITSSKFWGQNDLENEEIFGAAIQGFMAAPHTSMADYNMRDFSMEAAEEGILTYMDIPVSWIRKVPKAKLEELVPLARLFLHPDGLTEEELAVLAKTLRSDYGINAEDIRELGKIYRVKANEARELERVVEPETADEVKIHRPLTTTIVVGQEESDYTKWRSTHPNATTEDQIRWYRWYDKKRKQNAKQLNKP